MGMESSEELRSDEEPRAYNVEGYLRIFDNLWKDFQATSMAEEEIAMARVNRLCRVSRLLFHEAIRERLYADTDRFDAFLATMQGLVQALKGLYESTRNEKLRDCRNNVIGRISFLEELQLRHRDSNLHMDPPPVAVGDDIKIDQKGRNLDWLEIANFS